MDQEASAANSTNRRAAWALWIGVVIMFLIVITAWTTLIKIAKENPVETIELDTQRSD